MSVTTWREDAPPVVNVYSYTNLDLPPTPELFRWVATNSDAWVFGHLGAIEEKDGTITIVFRQTLMATTMQPEELQQAVSAVAWTADKLDDDIKARFGGRLFTEPAAGATAGAETPTGTSPAPPPGPPPVETPSTPEDTGGGYL